MFRDQEFSSDLGSRAVNRINNVRTMRGLQLPKTPARWRTDPSGYGYRDEQLLHPDGL